MLRNCLENESAQKKTLMKRAKRTHALLIPERGVDLRAQLATIRHAEMPLRRF
jgi:hypothetical protein